MALKERTEDLKMVFITTVWFYSLVMVKNYLLERFSLFQFFRRAQCV